jgi:dolichol-phosphate mannosyltransferase
MKILIAIATYNEAENLEPLTRAIFEQAGDAQILVVDDNSPDGTGEIADRLASETGALHVIHRAGKLGLGTATLEAVNYAVENGYDCLVTMDADFSHDPCYLPVFFEKIERADVVVGSRYISGGGVVNWPVARRLSSWLVNLYCSFVLRLGVHDYSGAYRAYRAWVLKKVAGQPFISKGYSFQEEMLFKCGRAGARLTETPIVFVDRAAGATKANRAEMLRSGFALLRLGLWGS